ncbi:MAG TPA: hypothetical protein VGA15_22720 [Bradyrhizobium sp.]
MTAVIDMIEHRPVRVFPWIDGGAVLGGVTFGRHGAARAMATARRESAGRGWGYQADDVRNSGAGIFEREDIDR